jgi:hypothetical protein
MTFEVPKLCSITFAALGALGTAGGCCKNVALKDGWARKK